MKEPIPLATGISEISLLSGQSHFFVIGAGVSAPTVKLSSSIAEECRRVCLARGDQVAHVGQLDAMTAYGSAFQQAFPHPADRRAYLESLVRRHPVSAANMRLANILESGRLGRLVVTTNFDDHLHRAVRLVGGQPLVFDHPGALERFSTLRQDIQIVHIHGTYEHYDCWNTPSEIERLSAGSALQDEPTHRLLQNLLRERSPIVIGYAGWEKDSLMRAVMSRLAERAPLPYLAYWFCYVESELASLPRPVRESDSIRFVVANPPQLGPSGERILQAISNEALFQFQPDGSLSPPITVEPLLPADRVFQQLEDAFSLSVPDFALNPVSFAIRSLEEAYGYADGEFSDQDVYGVGGVIEALKRTGFIASAEVVSIATRLSRADRLHAAGEARLAMNEVAALLPTLTGMPVDQQQRLLGLLSRLQGDIRLESHERERASDLALQLVATLEATDRES